MPELEKFSNNPEKDVKEILKDFKRGTEHILSMLLTENKYMSPEAEKTYFEEDSMREYQYTKRALEKYEQEHPGELKYDFADPNDPNIGWKFHLNVPPEFVQPVSEYLRNNGYRHKYLSGGDIDDGKIFTIYIGSYQLAKKLSEEISRDLSSYLCKPAAKQEIEFASGVVGRFVGDSKGPFSQYGPIGFSLERNWSEALYSHYDHHKKDPDYEQKHREMQEKAEEVSFKRLREVYGDYFFTEDSSD